MSEARFTGRVKWFDNKKGIGFITVVDGEKKDTDIFVHHNAIVVASEQFRYLVQGEYVEFSIIPAVGEKFDNQAGNVSGVHGGQLMCETKNDNRKVYSSEYKSSRGAGPREELEVAEPSKPVPRGRGRPSSKSKVA